MISDHNSRIVDTATTGDNSAPELRAFHDHWFEAADKDNTDVYGSPDDWTPIQRSGHFRRMAFLAAEDIGDITTKVAVDFGTAPWGFACMFPRLRAARHCYGLDVSLRALEIAASRDEDIAGKTTYLTSDGETIPLDDDVVDIFWGGEVIEHVRSPAKFIQEIARACRDGARVFLSTPNRDAIYYHARGEDYAIGPEHLALMNLPELQQTLEPFLSPLRIIGYETSLYPDLDSIITDTKSLDTLQDRAASHPQSASGMIIEGMVDKTLYLRNRHNWTLDERVWSDERIHGSATAERMRLFEGVYGGGIQPGQPLTIEIAGNHIVMLFWAHDWSGEACIELDGVSSRLDLYSPNGGFRRLELPCPTRGPHRVRVYRLGTECAAAVSDQVIFYKIMAYTVSLPAANAEPSSPDDRSRT